METKIPEGLTPDLIAEIKQYVFALYIGQKVTTITGSNSWRLVIDKSGSYDVHIDIGVNESIAWKAVLLLRPLSGVTDNEKIACMRAYTGKSALSEQYCMKRWRDVDLIIDADPGWHFISWLNLCSYQYLQQQGFALPVFYKGRLYSVAELEAMGIFKLQA